MIRLLLHVQVRLKCFGVFLKHQDAARSLGGKVPWKSGASGARSQGSASGPWAGNIPALGLGGGGSRTRSVLHLRCQDALKTRSHQLCSLRCEFSHLSREGHRSETPRTEMGLEMWSGCPPWAVTPQEPRPPAALPATRGEPAPSVIFAPSGSPSLPSPGRGGAVRVEAAGPFPEGTTRARSRSIPGACSLGMGVQELLRRPDLHRKPCFYRPGASCWPLMTRV